MNKKNRNVTAKMKKFTPAAGAKNPVKVKKAQGHGGAKSKKGKSKVKVGY